LHFVSYRKQSPMNKGLRTLLLYKFCFVFGVYGEILREASLSVKQT